MEFKETDIKGVYVIEPRVFNDARGYFFEAWKKAEFEIHPLSVKRNKNNVLKLCNVTNLKKVLETCYTMM